MTIERFHVGPRMSEITKFGNTVYLAGQVAETPDAPIEQQTKEVLAAIDALLAEVGTSKQNILQVQILLNNIADFAAMNAVYDTWVVQGHTPVRATFEARLASPSLKIEIIVVAAIV